MSNPSPHPDPNPSPDPDPDPDPNPNPNPNPYTNRNQIELRHGRKSGLRKIYINKVLVERVKTLKDLFSDVGSVHEFPLGDTHRVGAAGAPRVGDTQRVAQLHIVPKGFSGFTYQMLIDGQPIEQNWSGFATASTDVGSHLLDLRKAPGGELGLTLLNRDSRIGCVISHIEQGGVGDMAGLCAGDVVLAIDGSIHSETTAMSNAIFAASGVVSFEVAGAMPSREVRVGRLPLGCTLRSTSCRVGVLITDVTAGGPAANAGLTVGDLILSVNGRPIETAEKGLHALSEKDAAPCRLVVAGALVEGDTHCTC